MTPPKMRSDSLSAVVLTYFASDPAETHVSIAEDIIGLAREQVLGTITSLKKRGLLVRAPDENQHFLTPLGWAAIEKMKRKKK